jgi:hypothetical protein
MLKGVEAIADSAGVAGRSTRTMFFCGTALLAVLQAIRLVF